MKEEEEEEKFAFQCRKVRLLLVFMEENSEQSNENTHEGAFCSLGLSLSSRHICPLAILLLFLIIM